MPDIPSNVSLPLLGIGLVSLLLSFIFCIYMWRLRCRAREERGYKRIQYKQNKKFPTMCAVCLEEFAHNEYIAICRCAHCFHMICLLQWLKHRNFCPMCKATVQRVPPGERSSLITIPQQVVPSTSNEPATIDTETVWSRIISVSPQIEMTVIESVLSVYTLYIYIWLWYCFASCAMQIHISTSHSNNIIDCG